MRAVHRLLLRLGFLALALPVAAATAGEPVPRYASLDHSKVFLREGPSYRHRVLWVYRKKGLPVKIIAQYDVWRRVQDWQGSIGWIHSSMLSDVRTVIVTAKKQAPLRESPDPASKILALAKPGVIAKLEACRADACEVSTSGTDGWINKKNIWGVSASERFR
jgi:SH3-like domain-containing protein